MRFGQVLKHNKIFIIIFLAAVIVITVVFYFFRGRSFVPNDFKDARSRASQISSEIVSLLETSFENLDEIQKNDRGYNFSRALQLVYQEQGRVVDINKRAIKLNEELSKMAKFIPDIKPIGARDIAYEMVSDEVSLIGHLFAYSNHLDGLLGILQLKFSGGIGYNSNDVQIKIGYMNEEAKEINQLNNSFKDKLLEFDNLTR